MVKISKKRLLGSIVIIFIVALAASVAVLALLHRPAAAPVVSGTKTQPSKSQVTQPTTKQPVQIKLPGASPITARVADYTADSDIWTLVDKARPLSSVDYTPSPISIPNVATRTDKSTEEQSLRTDIAPAVEKLFAGAKSAGYDLVLASGYRSAILQKKYFDSYAASDGIDAANRYSARPGQSEHQTGLAFDITTPSRTCYLTDCFADTPEAQWVAAHAHEYGFIIRYPKDKEASTGYQYEPWHLRYLGVDLATAVHASGLTYEETWPYLVKADEQLKTNGSIQ